MLMLCDNCCGVGLCVISGVVISVVMVVVKSVLWFIMGFFFL